MKKTLAVLVTGLVFVLACADEVPVEPGQANQPIKNGPNFDHTSLFAAPATVDVNNYILALQPAFLGFGTFKGVGVMFAASIAYGNSASSVFFRNTSGDGLDFAGVGLPIFVTTAGSVADHQTISLAVEDPDEVLGPKVPLGLLIVRETFAFATAPDDDYVIVKYTLINPTANQIAGLNVGIMADPDVAGINTNFSDYVSAAEMARVTDEFDATASGLILLTHDVESYRGWANALEPAAVFGDAATNAEAFDYLSGGIVNPELIGPFDVRHLVSTGRVTPLSIAAGGSLVVAFALVAGDDVADLAINAAAARAKFPGLPQGPAAASLVPTTIVAGPVEYTATLSFGSHTQAQLFLPGDATCASASISSSQVTGSTVEVSFPTTALDPRLRPGDVVYCAGRLADGRFFVGSDTPTILVPLAPVTQLTTDAAADWAPTWSPDAASIAFSSDRAGTMDIWRLDVAAGEASAQQVTSGVDDDLQPDWSPDGSTILFRRGPDRFRSGIITVPVSGGPLTQLTLTQDEQLNLDGVDRRDWDPRYSPDGSQIAFRRVAFNVAPLGNHVWIMSTAGEIADGPAVPLATDGAFDIYPDWSPDGQAILFTSIGRPSEPEGIFSIVVATGEPAARVTPIEPAFFRHPAISPDGKTLAFVSQGGLILQDFATQLHTVVPLEPSVGLTINRWVQNLEFSPDGSRIVFVSFDNNIYMADVSQLLSPLDRIADIESSIQSLIDDGLLSSQNGAGLIASLDQVAAKLTGGQLGAAVNQLNAFINQVNALINSRRLAEITGQELTDGANALITQIESSP